MGRRRRRRWRLVGRSKAQISGFTWIPRSCPNTTRARQGKITTSVSAESRRAENLFEFFRNLKSSRRTALTALSPVVSGGAAFVFAPGSLAAAKRAGAALSSSAKASINAATCRTELKFLLGQDQQDSEVEACRAVAQEVELAVGDTLVLDLMLSHSGSPFREGVSHALGSARWVLFSVWADAAAIGTTLAGLPQRSYSAPASKYTDALREALPPDLVGLLDWQLPLESELAEGGSGSGSSSSAAAGHALAKL